MYQALYRKYRPKTFDDVFGQDIIIKTLKNSIIQDKISHAYLFAGPRGCGKTSVAKILAKTVNCQHLNGAEACNNCVCCTQKNNQNMDIIEIDAASNNGVDEIREINNKVNLVPSLGRYKVYIIDEVHMLTIGAFNALLKTLEEPPSHVIFILATTDPQKVPITILSRCQRFDFKKISEKKIYERLNYIIEKEEIKIEEAAIKEIARLGDGSLRDAISILDQVLAYADNTITIQDVHDVNGTISQLDLKQLMDNTFHQDIGSVMNQIDEYSNNGKSMVKIAEEVILFLRNIILSKIAVDFDNKEIYEEIKANLTNEQILNCIQIMNQTLMDMKKFSNPKLMLELGLIKILDSLENEKNKNIQPIVQSKPKENKISDNGMNDNETKLDKIEKDETVKESKKNISWEMKELTNSSQKNKEIEQPEIFIEFVDTRVNNTLSQFSKKEMLEIKQKLNNIDEYLLDEKYSQCASTILDGQLKAAGQDYLIFVYATQHLATLFNEMIPKIEKFLLEVLEKPYKVVAVSNESWNEIKEEFNGKRKKYEFQKENVTIESILEKLNQTEEDNMSSLFGDLVEYK